MNRDELKEWVKLTTRVVYYENHFDESSNNWSFTIYEKDGKLYKMSYCNGTPCTVWGRKGWEKDKYEPQEVRIETKVVEVTEYIPV